MVAEKISWDSIQGKEHPVLSPGFVSNGHVFTSGIIGSNYATGETPEKVEDQVHLAIKNLENVLKAAGSSLDKVFKVTMFISHAEYSKVVNEIYGQYFPQKPARSCVVVAFMDAAIKYELEAYHKRPDAGHRENGSTAKPGRDSQGRHVFRRVFRAEDVGRDEPRSVRQRHADGRNHHSSVLVRRVVVVPRGGEHRRRRRAGRHQEAREVRHADVCLRVNAAKHDEPDQRGGHGQDNENGPHAQQVRREAPENQRHGPPHVGRDRVQVGHDGALAERLDDLRKPVVDGVERHSYEDLLEHPRNGDGVSEHLYGVHERHFLGGQRGRVRADPPDGALALFLCEKSRFFDRPRQVEERKHRHNHGSSALDQEQNLPPVESVCFDLEQAKRQQPGERVGDVGGGIENRQPSGQLATAVERTQVIDDAGKKRRLAHPEKPSRRHERAVVEHRHGEQRDAAEREHQAWDHVGGVVAFDQQRERKRTQHKRDVEDGQHVVPLLALDAQINVQLVCFCVGNIALVERVEQIHYRDERQDPDIELPADTTLELVVEHAHRLAGDVFFVVCDALFKGHNVDGVVQFWLHG
ncbi:hypothetical protein KL919_004586 [Ogataea angusta]|nr:hypothetical protein KL919_004586 [Ogataea angusta]